MGRIGVSGCRGIVFASPASSSGKTTVTLGLLRLLARSGVPVQAAKSGPDYIDPTFQAAATGFPSINLDAWAMSATNLRMLAAQTGRCPTDDRLLLVEGAMGVLDGAGSNQLGSTAHLAGSLGLPVVLVIDVSKQGESSVLPVLGLRIAMPGIDFRGVILNRLGSRRHERIVRTAMGRHGIPVFGGLLKDDKLATPSRHLGLVPAGEHPQVDAFLDRAAHAIESGVDVEALLALAAPTVPFAATETRPCLHPPGQRISIARDDAFVFVYEHILVAWRQAGSELSFFSPLDDEMPDANSDAVYLPGGYPELHPGRIANAGRFRRGMHAAASRNAKVYGECGGYMVLGQGLIGGEGECHRMLGLLAHSTSFEKPKLHLGYRLLRTLDGAPFTGILAGHEFHYASSEPGMVGRHLFEAVDANGNQLGEIGSINGSVSGSFAHVICGADSYREDIPQGW